LCPSSSTCEFAVRSSLSNTSSTAVSYDVVVRSTFKLSFAFPIAAAALVAVGVTAAASTVATIDGAAAANAPAERIENQTQTQEPPPAPQPAMARYRVTIVSTWTAASHPTTLPSNSHFSPTVVAAHGEAGDLFVRGAFASPGIEQMAESGGTSTLRNELAGDPTVSSVRTGTSISGAGEQSFEITLDQGASMVSLVTMLAPSPDWFVGIRDEAMFSDGAWSSSVTLDLRPYDAGTDSGAFFRSPNADTNPPQVISGSRDAAFDAAIAEGSFGRVVIERI